MKCNKCGTPIIPGENACRICGNTDFSERIKEPEVIDFPEEVITDKNTNELPDLIDIIDIEEEPNLESNNELVQENVNLVVEPEVIEESTEQIVEQPVLDEPVSNISEEPIVETVEVSEEIVEDVKPNKKQVLDKVNKNQEKVNKTPKPKKAKKSSGVGIALLMILLMGSLALNAYLFIMDGNARAAGNDDNSKTEETYSKVAYNNYKITMPFSWITENSENSLLIYDDTQTWSASVQVVNDTVYSNLVDDSENKETFKTSLGSLKYQFTSDYAKKFEEKEFHLFKGKYYEDYNVFVIVTELDDTSVLVVDLKFKGEVNDILLEKLLKTMSEVKENNTDDLFKDNFEFQDISEQIKTAATIVEE